MLDSLAGVHTREIHLARRSIVSAAAGAVGTTAVQLARASGCDGVGVVGAAENARFLEDELGVRATINYRLGRVDEQLAAAAPDGIDVFLDNVGGELFPVAFRSMKLRGRIVVIGSMADLDTDQPAALCFDPFTLRAQRISVQGLIDSDFAASTDRFRDEMTRLLATAEIRNVETVEHGLDEVVPAFLSLFSGRSHLGKLIVDLRES